MNQKQQKAAAKEFVKQWKNRGYEKGDTHSFWLDLLRKVIGITNTTTKCKFEYHTSAGGFIDCYIPDCKTLVEQKALGIDLDKPEERQGRMVTPFQQALAYAQTFPLSQQPRFIIVSDFGTFRIHDRNKQNVEHDYVEFKLEDLPEHYHQFDFMLDPDNSRAALEERVSIQAGELIGKLHKELLECYLDPESPESQHSLNVLCVRLVFCLYCEDADLFEKDAFLNYLKGFNAEQMRPALKKLFRILDTPKEQRDPYDGEVDKFPYVNGGLFTEDIEIPNFTDSLRFILLFEASQQTNWSKISPTIFGGIFESTLNPETRRKGGMHYTSPESIHKVIDPLFLDALKDEFNAILLEDCAPKKRKRMLQTFRNKIGSLRFFDPACGSGNFLTETYLCLRELEDDVLNAINDGQIAISWDESLSNDERVSLDQFYGIEINDFAVRVAKTALWIAQLQADRNSEALFNTDIDRFPLSDAANITCGNALRMDWKEVLPAAQCDYVMGNPPFIGQDGKTDEQVADMELVWGNDYDGYLDYVTGWYIKAVKYFDAKPDSSFAFVSTNSICQGRPVAALFKPLFSAGWRISFAWPTFVWKSEAKDKANVHVVIVGMDNKNGSAHILFDDRIVVADNINPYLAAAPDFFIEKRSTPLSPQLSPAMYGQKPADGGFLQIKTEEEYGRAMADSIACKYVRRALGATELINAKQRWCLWLQDATVDDMLNSPFIKERIDSCREWRSASKKKQTRETAETPHLFGEIRKIYGAYLCLPRHFSGGRDYFTADYVTDGAIATDACFTIEDNDGFSFAILTSSMYMYWQNTVGGRLKSDCRFANTLVWNTFPVPALSDETKAAIIDAGKKVLAARASYEGESLAKLYDLERFPFYTELKAAHDKLDQTVCLAYSLPPQPTEGEIAARLVELYASMTE